MEATMYDMLSYQSSELYPQQILPVNTSAADGYNLPTPPHSPLQITDLSASLMNGHRQYHMDQVQTTPTDLSMQHDHLESCFNIHDVFGVGEKGALITDLPEFMSTPFITQEYFALEPNPVLPEGEDYVPSPTPSPIYTYDDSYLHNNYIPTPRSVGSVGYDSDQDGSLSDDTCVSQIHPSNRRQEELYQNAYHGELLTNPPRTHNYRLNTDHISISEITGRGATNGCSRNKKVSKKKTNSSSDQSGKRKPSRGKGRREAMKGNHLWEFIRDLLKNKTTCPRIIRWENRQEGVFRFVNSEAVAGLWGTKKNNPNMNYEKLSRAMRYYYKREILERVDGRRLVYKFGCNADGWREAAAEMTQDE